MNRQDFRFFHRLRVRWAEVDMQKIVFNAHYLMYIDTALADYWRALALPYEAGMQALGGDLYVKKATLEYHASARADDLLEVGLRCARVGTSSIVFAAGVFCGNRLLVAGEMVYVFADPATQTSKPVPVALRETLAGHTAGERMWHIRTGDWATLGADAHALRESVFVQEQGVPAAREQDGADDSALHAVAYNRLGMPLATARLLAPERGAGRLGRMAVHRALRGVHVGTEVLQTLIDASRDRGDREVFGHAQASASGFYSRFGFAPRGAPFDDVGIAHQEMVLVFVPDQMSASNS